MTSVDSGGNEEFILVSTFDKRRDIFPYFYEGNLLRLDEYCVSGHDTVSVDMILCQWT